MQSRTKGRPRELPLFDVNRTPGNKVMLPVEDYPVTWMIPRFDLPGILRQPGRGPSGHPGPWFNAINYDQEKLAGRGISNFSSNSVDVMAYVGMLAKIGHALAFARHGPNHFIPSLRHVILHGASEDAYEYVGGLPETPHDTDELHGLTLRTLLVGEARKLLAAEVRLFAPYGAPVHLVVVGELRG